VIEIAVIIINNNSNYTYYARPMLFRQTLFRQVHYDLVVDRNILCLTSQWIIWIIITY